MDYSSHQKKVPVPFPFNGRATFEVIHGYSRVWIVIDSVKLLQPKKHYVRSMVQCSMHVIKTKLLCQQ